MKWLAALLVLLTGLAQADPQRGLLLIYNARDDHSISVQLQLVEQLKTLRSSGHFEPAHDFSTKFATADLNVPDHARLVKTLGIKSPVPLPYLALVSLQNGQPQKLLWGERIDDVQLGLNALDARLGLQSATASEDQPPPWARDAARSTSRDSIMQMLNQLNELNERVR